MARAVTGGAAAFGRGVGTAYGGVRQGFQEPAGDAAYGPYPKNYVDLVKKHFTRVLRYPESANYTLGKPARGFFEGALASAGVRAGEAVMVGDDAEADVAGALAAGVGVALLVRTGKYRQGDEGVAKPKPTETVDDLEAAARWILSRR